MDRGRGSLVWDVDGNRFLDFAAGIAVVSTGHSHPEVVKAIQDQAEKFIHISSDFYHPKWVNLGEELSRIAPFSEPAISFMTNSGTESVEAAIKLARYYTGRSQFIGFLGGFHGRTMGAVTFTASKPTYHKGFYPLMNGVVHAPFPDPYRPLLQIRPGEDYSFNRRFDRPFSNIDELCHRVVAALFDFRFHAGHRYRGHHSHYHRDDGAVVH